MSSILSRRSILRGLFATPAIVAAMAISAGAQSPPWSIAANEWAAAMITTERLLINCLEKARLSEDDYVQFDVLYDGTCRPFGMHSLPMPDDTVVRAGVGRDKIDEMIQKSRARIMQLSK